MPLHTRSSQGTTGINHALRYNLVSRHMTKVQRYFQVRGPIDEALMEQIGCLNAVYGIERVRVEPSGSLMVEYDATRISTADVESFLDRAGIPVTA